MNLNELTEFGKDYAMNSPQKFKHCALIVKGDKNNRRIIAKGYNRYIMDLLNHNHSIHSEVAALEDYINNNTSPRLSKHKRISLAKKDFKKNNYDMIVIRIRKVNRNFTANSKPCSKCQKYLKDWNFRHIYYTT